MEQQNSTRVNAFLIVLVVALAALLVGSIGLIVSLRRPKQSTTGSPAASVHDGTVDSNQTPPGTSGPVHSTEINPSNGNSGVVESPKKN